MKKIKIVVFMPWYLPGTKAGGPVRSVFSLVNLLNDLFDFYIITSNKDLGANYVYDTITPNTLFLKEKIHYYYFTNINNNKKNILELLNKINPDLIYLNSFWSYTYAINIVRLKKKKLILAPVLLAPRGMLSKGALGLKAFKKNLYLFFSKCLGWYTPIYFHATNLEEANDIKVHFPSAKIKVASNLNSASIRKNTSIKLKNSLNLFFLSRISEVKNLDFALEVLKHIPTHIFINYDIYGNIEDATYWNKCTEIIKKLPNNICVTYKTELAFNEVQDVISNYHAIFLPTLNENFGHSIVESLMAGCIAIISDCTPWNDLEKNNAGFAISLSNKQAFITAITKTAELDQQAFLQKSTAANTYISSKTEVEKNIHLYKNLFNELVKN